MTKHYEVCLGKDWTISCFKNVIVICRVWRIRSAHIYVADIDGAVIAIFKIVLSSIFMLGYIVHRIRISSPRSLQVHYQAEGQIRGASDAS